MPNEKWLTSDKARKRLRISTCDLAHLRQAGQLRFRKEGNAYLYSPDDCEKFSQVSGPVTGDSCSIDKHTR